MAERSRHHRDGRRRTSDRPPVDPKVKEDIDTLRGIFPSVDKSVVNSVYGNFRGNFEASYKALEEMVGSAPPKITDDMKKRFLCAIFDKLNAPYIVFILEKYKMSVEACLDELLDMEAKRQRELEEIRRREEMERRRMEEEANRMREAQRIEMERRNRIINLQCMFPAIPQHEIMGALERSGWREDLAVPMLSTMESQRVQAERQRAEAYRAEQQAAEARRMAAEARALEEEAARIAKEESKMEMLMAKCNNWDEFVAEVAAVPVAPAVVSGGKKRFAGGTSTKKTVDELADAGIEAIDEKQAMINVAKEMFTHLDDDEIRAVFSECDWDVERAIPILDARGFDKVKNKLVALFPVLEHSKVEEVLHVYYPDDVAAIADLNPIASAAEQRRLQSEAVRKAQQALDQALHRQAAYEEEVRGILAQREKRRAEIAKMPEGKERTYMQTVDEMLTQKEDAQISETRARLAAYVEERRRILAQAQAALEALPSPHDVDASHKEQRMAHAASKPAPSAGEHLNSFQKLMKERESKQRELDDRMAGFKKTAVARKLRMEMGNDKFERLTEALGRAPGGVAEGFRRKDYAASAIRPPKISTTGGRGGAAPRGARGRGQSAIVGGAAARRRRSRSPARVARGGGGGGGRGGRGGGGGGGGRGRGGRSGHPQRRSPSPMMGHTSPSSSSTTSTSSVASKKANLEQQLAGLHIAPGGAARDGMGRISPRKRDVGPSQGAPAASPALFDPRASPAAVFDPRATGAGAGGAATSSPAAIFDPRATGAGAGGAATSSPAAIFDPRATTSNGGAASSPAAIFDPRASSASAAAPPHHASSSAAVFDPRAPPGASAAPVGGVVGGGGGGIFHPGAPIFDPRAPTASGGAISTFVDPRGASASPSAAPIVYPVGAPSPGGGLMWDPAQGVWRESAYPHRVVMHNPGQM